MSFRVVTQARCDARRRVAVACWLLFVAAGAVACLASRASGQEASYDKIKMLKAFNDPQVIRRMEVAARTMATARDANAIEDRNYATVYFERYIPTKITQPDAIAEISTLVEESTDLLSRAQRMGAAASRDILAAVYKGMKKVAEGNYHPAARINAALALGRLNQRPADRAAGRPPVPLQYSYPVLLKLYQDESAPDGVRAAALQGVLRYTKLGFPAMSDAQRTALQSEMTELLQSEAPSGRSAEAHAFLQRFAVDILDILRDPDDPQLGEQLVAVSTETDRPDLIALYSVARLGAFNGQLDGKVAAPGSVLEKWSARALRAFEDEVARLEALERPKPARNQPPAPKQFLQRRADQRQASSRQGGYGGGMMEAGMGEGGYGGMMGPGMGEGGYGGMMESGMGEGGYGDMMAPGMMAPGMMGRGMGMPREANPQPPEVLISRRKLNHVLQQLQQGVAGTTSAGIPEQPGGLLAAVDDASQPVIEDWLATVEQVVTTLNDRMHDDREKYVTALNEQIEVLRDLAGDEAPEAEAEPDGGAFPPLAAPNAADPQVPMVNQPIGVTPPAGPAASNSPRAPAVSPDSQPQRGGAPAQPPRGGAPSQPQRGGTPSEPPSGAPASP